MNVGLKQLFPSCMLVAEDSTSYPKITAPAQYDGLGFDYKWDLGWMNDTLDYFRTPPKERSDKYHKLTFSMHYFYQEHYLLPSPMTKPSTERQPSSKRCGGTMSRNSRRQGPCTSI